MKKTRVTYTPPIVIGIALAAAVLVILAGTTLLGEMGFAIGAFIGLVLFLYSICCKTYVEYGEGSKIKCRCAFYRWEIDLESVDSFEYTVNEIVGRYGSRGYSMDIRFNHSQKGVGDYYKLSSMMVDKEMEKMMRNDADKLEIMKIYKYAESLYPDKAKGYTKKDGIND